MISPCWLAEPRQLCDHFSSSSRWSDGPLDAIRRDRAGVLDAPRRRRLLLPFDEASSPMKLGL
jgi:hypothetical protein